MSKLRLKIGIISLSFMSMSALVVTNAYSAIIADFPNEPIAKIQMIGTIPSLGSLITTLFVGVLAMKCPKKILALFGILLTAIGGLVPIFFHSSINLLLGFALILGIGIGFMNTLSPMLLSEYFEGEERAGLMGIGTAITSLGSVVMMLGGGLLGASNWQNTYYIFLITILIFLLLLINLPMDKIIQKTAADKKSQPALAPIDVLKSMSKLIFVIAGLSFFMSFIYTIYPSNLSILINHKEIGGTSTTGLVNAIGTIGGFIAGFSLKYINRVTKDKTLALGFLSLALTFLISRFSSTVLTMSIGAILSGFAMAMVMATVPYYISLKARPFEIAIAMSVFQFLNSLGGIFSPIILSWLTINPGEQAFLFGGIACVIISLIVLVTNIGKRALNQAPLDKDSLSQVQS
ncbi:MFS transporter [Enterococcus casseliflavus]|uniref:MFS transporter n=1 Tax=Enterococcus casseliflavus TaxID=37734 RepID=UPI0039A74DD7